MLYKALILNFPSSIAYHHYQTTEIYHGNPTLFFVTDHCIVLVQLVATSTRNGKYLAATINFN